MQVVESTSWIVLKSIFVTILVLTTFMFGTIAYREYQLIQEQQESILQLHTELEACKEKSLQCQRKCYQLRVDRKYFERIYEAEDEMLTHCRALLKRTKRR